MPDCFGCPGLLEWLEPFLSSTASPGSLGACSHRPGLAWLHPGPFEQSNPEHAHLPTCRMSCNRCGTPKPADAGSDMGMGGGGFGGGGER